MPSLIGPGLRLCEFPTAGSTGQRNTLTCPIADAVAVSHGKLQADARQRVTSTSLKITTPTDRPYLAENLWEASVPARARSNRRDLQPSGDGVASDLDTRPGRPRQILVAAAPPVHSISGTARRACC